MNEATSPPERTVPWERQASESAKAFAAFSAYRDLPPSQRSFDEAGRRVYRSQRGRKRGATGRIREWAREHKWASRAAAWDAHLDRLASLARIETVREMQNQHRAILNAVSKKVATALSRKCTWNSMGPTQGIRVLGELIRLQRLVDGEPITIERVEHGIDQSAEERQEFMETTCPPEFMAEVIKILSECEKSGESPPQEVSDVEAAG
jgi:hypothetical protein